MLFKTDDQFNCDFNQLCNQYIKFKNSATRVVLWNTRPPVNRFIKACAHRLKVFAIAGSEHEHSFHTIIFNTKN